MIASAAMSKVQSYIAGVRSGDIVVGELVRLAVERHCRDLERQLTDDFPYEFKPSAAEISIDFFSRCLRHSIGEFAGMPFELEPFQAFTEANIHGWRRLDGSRKYRKVRISMARKGGKSSWGAGEAIYCASLDINPETLKPEAVAEVILCATKKDQAEKIIYAEILRMRAKSKAVRSRSTTVNRRVEFQHNDGFIECVGSDKPYDGRNSLLVIKDEMHAWKERHRDFYNTMTTGGASRCQPIDLSITTAGDSKSLIWNAEYDHAAAVLRGTIDDESTFAMLFEIDQDDDPLDESTWPKANPNLGVSCKLEYLREQAKEATSAIGLNKFTRYHCNRKVSSTERAFKMSDWDNCKGKLSDWSNADAIGAGVDIGGRDDLAALGLVAKFLVERVELEFDNDEDRDEWLIEQEKNPLFRYEVRAQGYIAQDTERDLTQAPFADWVHSDLIKRSTYPLIELKDDLIRENEKQWISSLAYDPSGGQLFAEEISMNTGMEIASMAQNYRHFHEPIQDFRQAMTDGRLRHDGNPVLSWCLGNSVAIQDPQKRWMLSKRDSEEKIDLAVAVLMAYRRAMLAPARGHGALYIT